MKLAESMTNKLTIRLNLSVKELQMSNLSVHAVEFHGEFDIYAVQGDHVIPLYTAGKNN